MSKWKIKHEKFDDTDKHGRKHNFDVSDETRQKLSEHFKGRPNTKLKSSLDKVLLKFRETHGDKYDYSKVEYVNTMTKVEVVCPEHGSWWVVPNNHKRGSGCPKCSLIRNGIKKKEEMHKKLSTKEGREQYGNFLKSTRGHKNNV
jgi:hypothetical protein